MAEKETFVLPNRPLVPLLKAFFRFVFRLLTRIHVSGQEGVPPDEPLLICANHLSYIDPPLVFAYVPQEQVAVMVAEKYGSLTNPIGLVTRLVDGFYVRRGEVDRQALKGVLQRLRAGRSVGVAPEGTRSKTGGLQPAKEGVAYLAQKGGVRILPVAMWGVEQIGPALKRLRRAEVFVVFGEPYTPTFDPTLSRQEQLAQASEELMLKIARMLPPAYRGVYRDKVAAEQATEQTT